MGRSVQEFIEQWLASSLTTGAGAQRALTAISPPPTTGEELAKGLIRSGELTKFQAQILLHGKGKSLSLGNYAILDRIGQGGMGLVYKARHMRMDRIVALKVLPPKLVQSKDLVERFLREAKAAARLHHPNIVTAFDADEMRGTHFLVMEFVDGSDLASLIKKGGVLNVPQVIDCILQAAQGLDYAHKQGVIHRDIKPANLLLDTQGVVKILDMGLARIEGDVSQQADLTGTGIVMGTVDYMSPEQALDTKHADARCDIYSLGITMWYLLIGQPVYRGDSLMARMLAHREAPIPSLCTVRADVPEWLNLVFQKMVAKLASKRFQCMTEVIAALQKRGLAQGAGVPREEDSGLQTFLRNLQLEHSPFQATTGAGAQASVTSPAVEPLLFLHDESQVIEPGSRTAPSLVPPAAVPHVAVPHVAVPHVAVAPVAQLPAAVFTEGTVAAQRKPKVNRWLNPRLVGLLVLVLGIGLAVYFGGTERTELPTSSVLTPNIGNPPLDGPAPVDSVPSISNPAGDSSSNNFALRFDGQDDYVVMDSLILDAHDYSQPLTVEISVRMQQMPVANMVSWMGENWIALFQYQGSWGVARLRNFPPHLNLSTERANFGRWVQLAGVWDGRACRLYVDGQLQQTRADSYVPEVTHGGLYLGGAPLDRLTGHTEGRWCRGDLDEVRISSTARYLVERYTPIERFSLDSETLALYHFDRGSGNQVEDASGNGNHGTIHGAQWIQHAAPSLDNVP